MNNNKIGLYIAECRKQKNMTQQELGDKLFVTDKAVSKWERGLSLPDISLLEKLAETLDTDIYKILQIENSKNVNIDIVLKEEKNKIKKTIKKKYFIITLPIVILIFIILFKLIPFGYHIDHVRYEHNTDKLINLARPKFSYFFKNNDDNFSYKSFRGSNILKYEIKSYLNSLQTIYCYNTTYYYDLIADITIVDYSVDNHFIYSNINYSVRNGNYCNYLELEEYKEKLGAMNKTFTLYKENSNLYIQFYPSINLKNNKNIYVANMLISYYNVDTKENILLEESQGTFEINNDELIYHRNMINKLDGIEIPNSSEFVIKSQKLILKDNYLGNYEKGIVLK